jgi:hypothetical protein
VIHQVKVRPLMKSAVLSSMACLLSKKNTKAFLYRVVNHFAGQFFSTFVLVKHDGSNPNAGIV